MRVLFIRICREAVQFTRFLLALRPTTLNRTTSVAKAFPVTGSMTGVPAYV